MKHKDVEEWKPTKEELDKAAKDALVDTMRRDIRRHETLMTDNCCPHCLLHQPIGGII